MMDQFGATECSEEYLYDEDCSGEFYVDGLDYCTYDTSYDNCTGETYYCNATFSVSGSEYSCDCFTDEGAECMAYVEQLGGDICEELEQVDQDCSQMFQLDGLDYCFYTAGYNNCTGNTTYCDASFSVDGQQYSCDCASDECDDMMDQFGATVCGEETQYDQDCSEMFQVDGLDYCTYDASYDNCTGETFYCNATFSVSGTEYSCDCETDDGAECMAYVE
jgi:hypothetical protein